MADPIFVPGGTPPETAVTSPAAPAATPAPASTWTDGFTKEQMQVVQGKAWKTPADAVNAYQHASVIIGTPPDRVVKLPATAEDPAWRTDVYPKLGMPEAPEKYDLGEFKAEEGAYDLTPGFRTAAHGLGLSQSQAKGLAEWFGTELTRATEARNREIATEAESQKKLEQEAIVKEFGKAYDEAALCVNSACAKFGISDELLESMAQGGKRQEIFRALASIGRAIGEHTTPSGHSGGGSFQGTPDWAKAEISRLEGDKDFMAAYRRGDEWAAKKRTELFALAFPSKAP